MGVSSLGVGQNPRAYCEMTGWMLETLPMSPSVLDRPANLRTGSSKTTQGECSGCFGGGGALAGAKDVQTDAKGQTSKKAKPPKNNCFSGGFVPISTLTSNSNVPGGGRTCNLRLRRATLYPIELPRQFVFFITAGAVWETTPAEPLLDVGDPACDDGPAGLLCNTAQPAGR